MAFLQSGVNLELGARAYAKHSLKVTRGDGLGKVGLDTREMRPGGVDDSILAIDRFEI